MKQFLTEVWQAFRPIPLTAQTQPVAYKFIFLGREETVGINNSGEIDNGDLGRHRIMVPSAWTVVTDCFWVQLFLAVFATKPTNFCFNFD